VVGKTSRTFLRNSDGSRYFLYLNRNDDGSWDANYNWLDNDRNADNVSPVSVTLLISPPSFFRSGGGVLFFQLSAPSAEHFSNFVHFF